MNRVRGFGRTRYALLGVLRFGPATGYEIKKLLTETTAHFWNESFGQIYPTLETLTREGKIEIVSERKSNQRGSKRYRLLEKGEWELRSWIQDHKVILQPGRNELLLKLFFSRSEDVAFLRPQLNEYREMIEEYLNTFRAFHSEDGSEQLPEDARKLIGTTIDYGIAATEMQIAWCERTLATMDSIG